AGVEVGRLRFGDAAERERLLLAAPQAAERRCGAAGRVGVHEPVVFGAVQLRVCGDPVGPAGQRDRGGRIPLLGVGDRWREDLLEWQFAEAIVQVAPHRRRAGNRYRQPAGSRDVVVAALSDLVDRQALWRATGTVEAVEFFAVPD